MPYCLKGDAMLDPKIECKDCEIVKDGVMILKIVPVMCNLCRKLEGKDA